MVMEAHRGHGLAVPPFLGQAEDEPLDGVGPLQQRIIGILRNHSGCITWLWI